LTYERYSGYITDNKINILEVKMNEVNHEDIIRVIRKLESDGSESSKISDRLKSLLDGFNDSSSQLPIDARINWYQDVIDHLSKNYSEGNKFAQNALNKCREALNELKAEKERLVKK
jgi:hypothetical protein